ncbi:hypothetical protein SteCoe_33998 [Stentor coeruleus]|uniref:C2H2-type domain-containing protein n=1 Tax=Stentor coeruleus TaxID=5963 RepID=A0A1R2AVV4_9CILI|nr:hypothetical protein SteCoe_33998 [Stentor coeruleus]
MVKREISLTPIKCSYPNCRKLLSSKYNLKRHIEFCHQGLRPHECSICFKRFSSKQNKLEHIRLEHSYSIHPIAESNVSDMIIKSDIKIPKLSVLLRRSYDPDIRPLSKIERVYLFPDNSESIYLPEVGNKQIDGVVLPRFAGINKV